MGFSWPYLISIAFCLGSVVVQGYEDFVILRHPPTNNGITRNLTCMSEDDDAALIWNYNYEASSSESGQIIFPDFQPKKPTQENNAECAISDSTQCLAQWEETSKWRRVDSSVEPMGPVFDYRWEAFKEFVFGKTTENKDYQYVSQVEASSSVVYSVRGLRDVHIFLCEEKDPQHNPCFWIIIAGWIGKKSVIRSCATGAPDPTLPPAIGNCTNVREFKHEDGEIINPYEWRTFILKWKDTEKTIEVFKDNEYKPFLEGKLDQWFSVSHISVRREITARVRFHFYKYFLTENNDAVISTKDFQHNDKNFCVKLLVALCPKCKLDVNLVGTNHSKLNVGSITGDENNTSNGLLTWRSVEWNRSLENFTERIVKLEIRFITDKSRNKSQLAIDSFRMCQSVDRRRISTITTHRDLSSRTWPTVNCQKLSYSENALVDSLSTEKYHIDISGELMEQIFRTRDELCQPECIEFGKNWSVCQTAGCSCDLGFTGRNCTEKIGKPTVVNITDTTATVVQKIKLQEEVIGVNVTILDKASGSYKYLEANLTKSGKSLTYRAYIENLKMNTVYTVYTIVMVRNASTTSEETSFLTTCLGKPLFSVKPHETYLNVTKRRNGKGCENRNGPFYSMRIYNTAKDIIIHNVHNPQFPYNQRNLTPYTEYNVAISNRTSGALLIDKKVRTLESAPSGVQNLTTKSVSDTNVTLSWDIPLHKNGLIRNYIVLLKIEELIGCKKFNKETPKQSEYHDIVNDTTVFISGLNPYAKYTATVTANTTKPGPKEEVKFETLQSDIPGSAVSELRLTDGNRSLGWRLEPENCNTITGEIRGVRLFFEAIDESLRNQVEFEMPSSNFSFDNQRLEPYTKYRVRVHVTSYNQNAVNPNVYRELTWTTLPTAPPSVKNFSLYEADPDTNTVSLRWLPPCPAKGEVESYRVLIYEGKILFQNYTTAALKGEKECKLQRDYVYLKNVSLPQDMRANNTTIKVYAMNKDVTTPGDPHSVSIGSNLYNEEPGEPVNLTWISQGHGIVTLNWAHPAITPVKITQFYIHVDVLCTNLRVDSIKKSSLPEEYIVKSNQTEYSVHLVASTDYKVSVVAANRRNFNSTASNIEIKVPGSVAFESGEILQARQSGSMIEVEVPKVVNATKNTRVKVIVRGWLRCAQNDLNKFSSSFKTMNWIAAQYKVEENIRKLLRIGGNESKGVTHYCSLHFGETYEIMATIEDGDFPVPINLTSSALILKLIDEPQIPNLGWLVILPILAICATVFIIRRQKRKSLTSSEVETSNTEHLMILRKPKPATPPPDEIDNRVPIQQCAPDLIPYNPHSYPVESDKFEEYTKEALANRVLESQYAMFTRILTKPCEYGKLPKNISKNRYKNLITYDDTRVVLQKIPDDPYSDYINASYIPAYRKGKVSYIATQGPMPNTVIDFWRMVWEKKVHVICMLANIIENGKKKCEQYWPEIGTKIKYGDIHVSNINYQVFGDYTSRTFTLSFEREKREVTHLHYTGWPDHGVPMFTQSIVPYLKKLLNIPTKGAPIVVHCSAGVGRTGTIILCDTCLRQARQEKIVDLPAVTARMREFRARMVDNEQQYVFAHLAIAETMFSGQTEIPCDNALAEKIEEMRKKLPSDIQRLKDNVWQDRALHFLGEPRDQIPQDVPINLIPELVPETQMSDGADINFMNTITIDGFKTKNQYLVSRLPSPSTRSDMWKLIAQEQIELIIILQHPDSEDPMCCDLMPRNRSQITIHSHIKVETKASHDEAEHFTTDKFSLTDTSEGEARLQPVTLITCTGWGRGRDGKPPPATALVSLWMASEKISRKEGPTLVLCHDGVTGCGLYLALSFLLERMAVEKECDVISAVRAVRRFRPQFVQPLEQFEYLYDAALCYDHCFEIYANFS